MFKGAADAVKRATAGLTTAPATKKSTISGTAADSSSPTIAYPHSPTPTATHPPHATPTSGPLVTDASSTSGGGSSYTPQQRPVVAATQQPAAPTQQQATSTPGAAVHSTPADAVGLSSTTSPQPAVGTATAPVLQATAQVLRDSTPACTATQTTPGGAAYSTPSASPAVQSLGLPSVGSALTTGVLPESDSNNDDEGEEDEEEVEPQLKYTRLGGNVPEILRSNNASCIAIYALFLALGTHTGKIFILDFQGNQVISFESHDYTVNEISIDGTGDYLASCSDDGRVVINALMAKEVITCEYHRPIKAVSIDPNYIRKNTRQYCVGGSSGHLMVNVKGILKAKDVVIHQGQGAIHTIKWKGQFIAWASDTGIRVWDVSSRQQIGAIPREPGSPRPDLYRCCLCWEDERTLIIGWADGVKICEVKERPPTDPAGFFLQITAKFKTDFFISGVAPYGSQLVLLAYIEENTDPEGRPVVVPERYHPEFRLMSRGGREFVSDAIDVEGYKDYHATAYRLEYSLEEAMFFLVAPKDIVVARPRDMDDHIDWLLEKHKFAEALMECEHETPEGAKKYARIAESYLNDLISKQEYTKAVRVCVETFGSDPELWEKWIITFTELGQLARLVDYIPTRNPTLKTVTYTNVILYFLRCDPDRCLQLISAWESLFDVKEIFIAMKTITPTEKRKLGVAQLYTNNNAYKIADPEKQHQNIIEAQVEHLNATVSELKTQKELVANLQQALKEEAAKSKSYQADVAELQQRNERLQREKRETEAALCEERICVASLKKSLKEEAEKSTRYKDVVDTMISLISATADDFRVDKLLGTGSNAAAFKVQHLTTINMAEPPNLSASLSGVAATTAAITNRRGDMVMKVLFNWENTPRQTMLRQKYMAECVILSLLPNHPNVIHPLGALVLPCLPADFVEKIPSDKKYFREELCNNKSLAILMPHCGITLSSLFSSSSSTNKSTAEDALNLFVQGLEAVHHIESHSIVHRDIKEDNILVDPTTGKLTLIDFGEAQHCPATNTNMELSVSATTQPWGNAGTMPPELSTFLRALPRGTSGVFSFSKCDSFALALTFWDALLPPSHKFIGSTMNHNMGAFNTRSLLTEFPLPSLFPSTSTPPSPTIGSNGTPEITLLAQVMIGMMNPDKAARVSAADAISSLRKRDNGC